MSRWLFLNHLLPKKQEFDRVPERKSGFEYNKLLSSAEMPIDFIRCLQGSMPEPEHHILKTLVLSSNHSEGDRVTKHMRRHFM